MSSRFRRVLRPSFRLPAHVVALVFALAAMLANPATGFAQNSLFSTAPSGGMIGQSPLMMPEAVAPLQPMPMVPAGHVALALAARFGKAAPAITGGLTWRVFSAKPGPDGTFHLVKEDTSPSPTLVLPAGDYIVHVGFGLATAVKPVTLRAETVHEVFDLPAGALRLEGKVGDVRIPAGQISFNVYRGSQFEAGDRRPIAEHMMTGD